MENPLSIALSELIQSWQESPHPSLKVTHYFPVYVQLFAHLRGTSCTFVETGVLDGGSLFMWRRWLGDKARIIGIDLNPEALKWKEHGFEMYIGDQGDPEFWRETFKKIGKFDALLDDGGHQSFQQIVTATEAIKAADHECVIAIEDTYSSFFKDFSNHGKRSFLEYCKAATDLLTFRSHNISPGRFSDTYNAQGIDQFNRIAGIHFYNGIVAFQVSPNAYVKSEIIRNKESNGASDFRYEGLDQAVVEWPNVFQQETVIVKGGQN